MAWCDNRLHAHHEQGGDVAFKDDGHHFIVCKQQPCPNRGNSITETVRDFLHPTTDDDSFFIEGEEEEEKDSEDEVSEILAPIRMSNPVHPGPSGHGAAPAAGQQQAPDFAAMMASLIQNQLDLQQSVKDLATAVTTLTNNIGAPQVTVNAPEKNIIQRPAAFKGTRGVDARRFLAAFTTYAQGAGSSLNIRQPGGGWHIQHTKWIASALSFLEDDAAIWATPYLEAMGNGQPAFSDNWVEFIKAFKLRFETTDEAVDAKESLRTLWQGTLTVSEYAAKFKEVMDRTGYSIGDLRDRFYDHLASTVKDALVNTERDISTLDKLIEVSVSLDNRIRQRRAEKARETGKPTTTASRPSASSAHITPFTPTTARDPNAMDIDASKTGKTRLDFLRVMSGRCFGCGSKDHTKANGHHKNDVCDWCLRLGHRGNVCQDKFMGNPRKTRAAATSERTLYDPSAPTPAPASSASLAPAESSSSATISASSDVINALLKQQEELTAQMDALKKSLF